MQITKQYELPEGIIYYSDCTASNCKKNETVCITAYEGNLAQLIIPSQINGMTVSAIGRKAFLGNRCLFSITLPDTIETIGDWAFSRCYMLQNITLPKKKIDFGNQVFQKSNKLDEIYIVEINAAMRSNISLARLMASTVTILEAEYLLSPLEAGSSNWYQNLDSRILTVLRESEDSALKNLVYCAEEDMGAKQEACLRELAHRKAGIAFLRLIYPENITDVMYQNLTDYLRQRTKGCDDESAWEFIKQNRKLGLQYCDILYEIGGINEDNINEALDDLGEDNIELKAYLLKKWQSRKQSCDVWETLKFE